MTNKLLLEPDQVHEDAVTLAKKERDFSGRLQHGIGMLIVAILGRVLTKGMIEVIAHNLGYPQAVQVAEGSSLVADLEEAKKEGSISEEVLERLEDLKEATSRALREGNDDDDRLRDAKLHAGNGMDICDQYGLAKAKSSFVNNFALSIRKLGDVALANEKFISVTTCEAAPDREKGIAHNGIGAGQILVSHTDISGLNDLTPLERQALMTDAEAHLTQAAKNLPLEALPGSNLIALADVYELAGDRSASERVAEKAQAVLERLPLEVRLQKLLHLRGRSNLRREFPSLSRRKGFFGKWFPWLLSPVFVCGVGDLISKATVGI